MARILLIVPSVPSPSALPICQSERQTTKVELIKILRAQTSDLIDYIQGGYFGVNGGTGGSTTSTGSSTSTGTTPAVVQLSPYGGVGVLNQSTLPGYRMAGNNIILDANGLAPTYFDMGTTVKIGNQPILDYSNANIQLGYERLKPTVDLLPKTQPMQVYTIQ